MLTKTLYFVQNKSFNIIYLLICWQSKFGKKLFYPYLCPKGHTITPKMDFCPKCCQKWSIMFNLIISNAWCQIVLVPNCPVAKLSTFIILVPNCPLSLSWCQIVCFIILVPNCPEPNCPTIKNPASLIFWPKFGMKTWGNAKNAKNSTYLSKNFFLLLLLYLIGKILG